MRNLSKISQQTFWQILGKAVTSLSTFIILGMVARSYGAEGTGVFTLALTYLAIFYLLADFGFNAHVLRKCKVQSLGFTRDKSVKRKVEWQKLLGTRLVWSAVLVILAVGLLYFWPFATPVFSQAVIFGSLAIIGSSIFITCNLIFQSKLRYDLSSISSSIGAVIGLIITVWLIIVGAAIPYLVLGHLIGWLAVALVSLILVNDKKELIFDLSYTKNLFKESWPIAVTLALNVIYFRADSFMIAYFKGVSDVGIYNMAYSVFQSALVLPAFIMNSYYPLMLKSLGEARLIGISLLGLSVFGTVMIFNLSPMIMQILTGGGFAGSTLSLQILSLGLPAYFLSSLLMWMLITKGKYKSTLLVCTSGLILNLMLNFIFIPKYSYIAAAWTTVVSEYFILAMQAVLLLFERSREHIKR